MSTNPYAPPETPEPPETLRPPEYQGPWSPWTVFALTFAALGRRRDLLLTGALIVSLPGLLEQLIVRPQLDKVHAAPVAMIAAQAAVRLIAAWLEAGYVAQWLCLLRGRPVPRLLAPPSVALPVLAIELVKATTVDLPDFLKDGTGLQLSPGATLLVMLLSLSAETTVFTFGRAIAVDLRRGGLTALGEGLVLLQRAGPKMVLIALINLSIIFGGLIVASIGFGLMSAQIPLAVIGGFLALGGLVTSAAVVEGSCTIAYLFARHSTAVDDE